MAQEIWEIEILEHREIQVVDSGSADDISSRVPECAGCLKYECIRVDVLSNRLLAAIDVRICDQVRSLADLPPIGETNHIVIYTYLLRQPGMGDINPRQLPTAQGALQQLVRTLLEKRQVPNVVDTYRLGLVLNCK